VATGLHAHRAVLDRGKRHVEGPLARIEDTLVGDDIAEGLDGSDMRGRVPDGERLLDARLRVADDAACAARNEEAVADDEVLGFWG
jgi:hypothetical protein